MSEGNNNNNEELRRFAEQGMQGAWHLCPECMSNDVWMISCEYKNERRYKSRVGKFEKSFIIASMCEKCKFYELAPDMKDLGMDKVDWSLVTNKQKVFET